MYRPVMSLGVARARGSSWTITSYCLLARVNVPVLLPPRSTWSVVATSPRHAQVFRTVAVEAHLELRLVDPEVAVHVLQAGDLARPREQGVVTAGQRIEVGVLDDEVDRATEPEGRRVVGEHEHAGDAEELGLHLVDDVLHGPLPLGPVVEIGEDHAAAHPVTQVHHAEVALDALGPSEDGLGLALVAVGVRQRGALGRDHEVEEPPLVLGRHELALERAEHHDGAAR